MDYPVIEELSRDECLALLRGSRVGRVGISIRALPAILPVNFVVIDDAIVVCMSGPSTELHANIGSVVAFEVDCPDEAGFVEWSVLVHAIALELSEVARLDLARSLWLEAWPLEERADRFVVMSTTMMSGQRFT